MGWTSLRITIRAAIISALISGIISLIGVYFSSLKADKANKIALDANITAQKAVDFTEKEFETKYTPDIRVYIPTWNVYVGEGGSKRIDNIILIPTTICNKSYGLAKDVTLNIVYNDGTWESDKKQVIVVPVLKGGESSRLPDFAPSILAGAYDKYLSKDITFRMKVLISWKNASNESYNSVESFKLEVTEAYSDSPSRFVLVSQYCYTSIDNKNNYIKHSEPKIDF